MNDRERVEALLRGERPDRVPIWPCFYTGFAATYTGTSITDMYNKPEVALAVEEKTTRDLGWVFVPMFGYASYGAWEFGGEIEWPSGELELAPKVCRLAVETVDDIANLKAPDVRTAGFLPLIRQFCDLAVSQEQSDREPFRGIAFGTNMSFSLAGNIVGSENLCIWILEYPDAVHRLLALANEHIIQLAEYWKELYGVDGLVMMGDETLSSNYLISPQMYKDFALPYAKELNRKLLEMGYRHLYVHICGEHNANMEYLAQIPMGDPGIISIGHEVSLETAAKAFPNDIILGNMNPTILQTGTADEVYDTAKRNVLQGMELSQGFIFSPGCEIPPMAPIANIHAMNQAVIDHGWY